MRNFAMLLTVSILMGTNLGASAAKSHKKSPNL
jgi:hypothetical protein